MVSIRIRAGFNQDGAPPGSSLPALVDVDVAQEDIIIRSHRGRPIDSVNKRCVVKPK